MTILDTILNQKRKEISERILVRIENDPGSERPIYSLRKFLLDTEKTGIIAEFKRKSPSKGAINENADVQKVTAAYYANGASGLSILTDENFFGGSMGDLRDALSNPIPVLRKDFIIDESQVTEARHAGADAILLIAACLTVEETRKLASFSKKLGMEVLLELHDEKELGHICDEIEVIGINNRNLRDFSVDIENSLRLGDKIPNDKIRIAESGIDSPGVIMRFKQHGFHGFLIGELFMKEPDPGKAFSDFVKALK